MRSWQHGTLHQTFQNEDVLGSICQVESGLHPNGGSDIRHRRKRLESRVSDRLTDGAATFAGAIAGIVICPVHPMMRGVRIVYPRSGVEKEGW